MKNKLMMMKNFEVDDGEFIDGEEEQKQKIKIFRICRKQKKKLTTLTIEVVQSIDVCLSVSVCISYL